MTNKEETKVVEAIVEEVPTQTALVVRLQDGRQVSDLGLLVEIYNDLQIIKKAI